MKLINPLHIIVLLLVVLVFLWVKLSSAKEELEENKQLYQETLVLSTALKSLSDAYFDKKGISKSIGVVLNQTSLKTANIKQIIGKSSIILSSESIDQATLNSLMSKILNGSYRVHSLHIKKLSKKKASFTMELKW